MELRKIKENEFNDIANTFACNNFFQTSYMGDYLKSKNKEVYYIGLWNDNKYEAVTMISESYSFLGKKSYECLKGILIDYKNKEVLNIFLNKLKDFVKEKKGYKLVIDPYIIKQERDIDGNIIENDNNNFDVIKSIENIGFNKSKYDTQVRFNFCLDLKDKTKEVVFKNFKATTRNIINKAIREGVEIFNISYNELSEFKKITEYTCNKRGFKDKSLEYYQKMYNNYKDKVIYKIAKLNVNKYIDVLNKTKEDYEQKVSKIEKNNKKKENYLFEIENINKKIAKINSIRNNNEYITLAGAMFMLYGNETIYLFSGSYDELSEYGGQYLIQWDIINYAIDNNYNRHNFFGILNFTNPKDKDYGIYLFKRGFDGYVEELLGEYEYVIPSIVGLVYKIKNKVR